MPFMRFKLDMLPPRTTSQQKGERIVGKGKNAYIHHYQKPKVEAAQNQYIARLLPYRPMDPIEGPVRLRVEFRHKTNTKKLDGKPKTTRPDTDNMVKLLKDCMTKCRFWGDDSQVYDERVLKSWSLNPGIEIWIGWGEDVEERNF